MCVSDKIIASRINFKKSIIRKKTNLQMDKIYEQIYFTRHTNDK